MKKFNDQYQEYLNLLEQDISDPSQAAMPQQMDQNAQPPQPQVESQPASVGYAVMAQLILNAYKTIDIPNKNDIKFSDNKIRTPEEAYKYLEIIKRNLAPDLQKELTFDVGKSTTKNDLDSADLIKLTQLALQALFFRPKDVNSSEFNNVIGLGNATVENAKDIVNQIQLILAER